MPLFATLPKPRTEPTGETTAKGGLFAGLERPSPMQQVTSGVKLQWTPAEQIERHDVMLTGRRGPKPASNDAIGFAEAFTQDIAEKMPFSPTGALKLADIYAASKRLSNDFYAKPPLFSSLKTKEQLEKARVQGAWVMPTGGEPDKWTPALQKQYDTQIVETYLKQMAERQRRGYTFGGKVGAGLSILPAWMIEFGLTGGLKKIGSEAAKEFLEKRVKSRLAQRGGAWLAGAATRTTFGMPHRVAAATLQNKLKEEPDNWATAIAKGWAEIFIETASEEAGSAITAGGKAVLAKMPLGSQLMRGLERMWTSISPKNTSARFWKKIFTKAGYSNIVGEIGEERLATFMHAIVGTQDFGAGKDAGPLKRIVAGIVEDAKNFPVEGIVLATPAAARFGLAKTFAGRQRTEAPPISEIFEPGELEALGPVEEKPAPEAKEAKPQKAEGEKRPREMTKEEFVKAHKDQFRRFEGKRRLMVLSSDGVSSWSVPKESQKYGKLTKAKDAVLADIFDRYIAPQQTKPQKAEAEKQPWEMTKKEFAKTYNIPKPKIPSKKISDIVRTLDETHFNREKSITFLDNYIKDLKKQGFDYIDGYHVTDIDFETLKKNGIKGTEINYIGETSANNLRPSSVYLFLDPDDIFAGYAGIPGAKEKINNVVHLQIPVSKLKKIYWDSNFNVSFGTYSSVRLEGNIPASWIHSTSKYNAPAVKDYIDKIKRSPEYYYKNTIQQALSENKPVPRNVLEEYKGEKWADEAIAKAEKPGTSAIGKKSQPKGILNISGIIDALRTPLKVLEPAKLAQWKHGQEPVAATMRGTFGKREHARLVFDNTRLEQVDMTIGEWGELLDKYPDETLHDLMLTRGHGLEGKARQIQRQAFVRLPKELKASKLRRAIDEMANFCYDYGNRVIEDLNYVRDYFYGQYKNPKKVTQFLKFWKTTKRWTKHKVFPTYAEAKAYGLELKNPNPVANLRAEYLAIAQVEAMQWLKGELMRMGKGRYIAKAQDAPYDWEIIGEGLRPEPAFADVRVEPELARLINNLISTNKITRQPVLNAIRQANNFLRTIKFIGSAFHMMQILKQSVADSGYLGFYKPTAARGFQAFFKDFTKDPQYADIYKWYVENGGEHRYAVEYEAFRAFKKAIRSLNKSEQAILKGASLPGRIPLGFVHWMFNSYIPSVKFAKFMDTVGTKEKKLGRSLTPAETQEIIKEQQNFYGMMNERLFGRSGTTTTSLRFAFMAPAYAEGNYKSMLRAATQWGIAGQEYSAGRSRSNIVNSWIITATLATIATRILTGLWPKKPETIEEMRDLLKIDTGKTDKRGEKIMIDLATYDKDYWNVFFNTLRGRPDIAVEESIKRIGGMKAPSLQLGVDLALMVQGKAIYDWKEDRVYHITDPFLQKVMKTVAHETRRLIPISASVFKQSRQKGIDKVTSAVEMLLGLRPARTYRDEQEFKLIRDLWDMRDKREQLSYLIGRQDDPWAVVQHYNATLDKIAGAKFSSIDVKTRAEKLKIDPANVYTWKRFPISKMTAEQLKDAIARRTWKDDQYLRYENRRAHKGWEKRVEEMIAELRKRQAQD